MKRYAICTTCGQKHSPSGESPECRACRGWHVCPTCEERLPNTAFYRYKKTGREMWRSACQSCEARRRKAHGPSVDRNRKHGPNHDNASQVYAAYEITRKERYVVQKALKAYRLHNPSTVCRGPRPKSPTPVAVLEAAGYGFDLRISQAVIELYRLETAKREAA